MNQVLVAVLATVISVTDGDTIKVKAQLWPQMITETTIRISGLDTPEKGWRAKCSAEAALADTATAFSAATLTGRTVYLLAVEPDKYGGRFLARVQLADGQDFGTLLIEKGLARPYDGGTRRPWC
jgi:micrococcal nuclease